MGLEAASADEGQSGDATEKLRFEFRGSASEYFRIWIVNLALTLVTLGIYSPWAKVRSKRYIYRNTYINGDSFDYTGDPKRILMGRLILAVVFGAAFVAQQVSSLFYLLVLLFTVAGTPWLMAKALAFNARNTVYRGVRFSFHGGAGRAYKAYFGAVFVSVFTLGLGGPYGQWLLLKYMLPHHRYGDAQLDWGAKAGALYRIFFGAMALWLLTFLFVSMPVGALLIDWSKVASQPEAAAQGTYSFLAVFYSALLPPAAYSAAQTTNLIYGALRVGPHAMSAELSWPRVLGLYLTNLVAVVASLGLAIPWAKIRLARYLATNIYLQPGGPLEVKAASAEDPSALGEAAAEHGILDFDFGI